jgi:hypothetical protein
MKQSGGKGKPPPLPRRRRHLPRRIRRGALWLLLAVAVAGSYGAILATACRRRARAQATDRFIGDRRVGVVVNVIEVQGRETDIGPSWRHCPRRAACRSSASARAAPKNVETLPWARSTIERLCRGPCLCVRRARSPSGSMANQQPIDHEGRYPRRRSERFSIADGCRRRCRAPCRRVDRHADQQLTAPRVTVAVRVGGRR